MAPTNTHNGVPHDNEKGSVHMEEHTSHQPLPQNPIQLTPAQYERLFFQPGGGPRRGDFFEWALGNTFPFVLRLSLGHFPTERTLLRSTTGSNSTFTFWAILCALYLIAAVRTNVVFMYVFLTLVLTFAFLAAAYRQSGLGNANMSLTFLKTAGAFGFATSSADGTSQSFWFFAAVDMPFDLPVGDLSRFLNKRKTD
ncbi:hypothetical protein B0H14DRAFT_2931555 [Mycena olivaceomarginata]|nr:hypothetical protein B0H14DRAFT_2931555 [Mycena olivaceomarginata]